MSARSVSRLWLNGGQYTAAAAATTEQRSAMANMTGEALAELKTKGLVFQKVDVSLFRDKVKSVYERNAAKVGGMGAIEELTQQ